MSENLAGKVAVVTGAASGIGRASARAFAREGCEVFVCDINDDGAAETVKLIREESAPPATRIHLDVCDPQSVDEAFGLIDQQGAVANVVMNCAGGARPGDGGVATVADEAWQHIIELNLNGTYRVCKAAISRLLERSLPGSIINVSARAAFNGIGLHAYAAAKGGVAALSRSIGVTYGRQGIRCNALAPGPIDTALISGWASDPVKREANLSRVPVGRPGQPEEVAELAVFLASDRSAYMTACVLPIDGGASAS
jgi:NAD(P)-dependent dehydrogenase (short-subunit alcohol dehydrogenase family)